MDIREKIPYTILRKDYRIYRPARAMVGLACPNSWGAALHNTPSFHAFCFTPQHIGAI